MAISESIERTPTFEVSPDRELTIPASVLAKMGVQPGQKYVALTYNGTIRLIPLVSADEARGSMPGLDTTVDRDDEERI